MQEGNTLVVTFVFALIIIYLVLAAQYESFRDPLIILIALPTAMFGALIPLNLGLATINIYTQVGLVTLIGLISKHGILMVDYANHLQENEGLDRRAAIEKAAAIRLRPILMTTAAMVVGMVPLLTASGAGAASRYSIGLVIAAGMTIGTLFTLFVTPAVYTYVARDHRAHGSRGADDGNDGRGRRGSLTSACSSPGDPFRAKSRGRQSQLEARARRLLLSTRSLTLHDDARERCSRSLPPMRSRKFARY